MWFKRKQQDNKEQSFPVKDIPLEKIQSAIHAYAKELPVNVPLKILIQEDRTIDYTLLAPFLKAIPKQTYYMSKETYDIFTEEEKHIAEALDLVQRAVDQYIRQTDKLPVIDYDPYYKVNYFKLEQLGLITERPDMDFYITDQESLITTQKPE